MHNAKKGWFFDIQDSEGEKESDRQIAGLDWIQEEWVGVVSALLCQSWRFSDDLPSNRAVVDEKHHGCKCEPKDRLLITRSHTTVFIFSSTEKVIFLLVMVEEIMDDEDDGEKEK